MNGLKLNLHDCRSRDIAIALCLVMTLVLISSACDYSYFIWSSDHWIALYYIRNNGKITVIVRNSHSDVFRKKVEKLQNAHAKEIMEIMDYNKNFLQIELLQVRLLWTIVVVFLNLRWFNVKMLLSITNV